MLTKEEKTFLYNLLDQVSIRGVTAKAMVLVIMGKLADEDAVPDEVTDETRV